MADAPDPAFALFLDVFLSIPRQGPGSRASTTRALAACSELPSAPRVLDIGCGAGTQTLDLAGRIGGEIVAVDRFEEAIAVLRRRLEAARLGDRVTTVVADVATLEFPPGRFDLVWSEGALYNLGIPAALRLLRPWLAPRGWLAFTDLVWTVAAPPDALAATMREEYPEMSDLATLLERVDAAGFDVATHFTLPAEDWWTDFYTPMLATLDARRERHAGDAATLAILDRIRAEPESHEENARSFAYEFVIARRRD